LSNHILKRHAAGEVMDNLSIVRELLSYPLRRVFASTVYREDARRPTLLSPDPRRLARPFRHLVENVSLAAQERDIERTVTLVFDQRLGAQRDIAIAVTNFVKGMDLSNVHPYPYFAVSNVSPGVQFADVFATILSKRAQKRGGIIPRFYTELRRLNWISEGPARRRYGLNRFTETGSVTDLRYAYRKSW